MSDYRRWYVPGGTYFFTVVTCNRHPFFSDLAAVRLLGEAFRSVRKETPFRTEAIVLLPDHLHAIWTLPSGDQDYAARWKAIKDNFTIAWLASGGHEEPVTNSQMRRGHRGIWQRRYWEHSVRDEDDFETRFDYIHFNPVKHHLVQSTADWPWSTFHRHVKSGHYQPSWGSAEPENLQGLDFE